MDESQLSAIGAMSASIFDEIKRGQISYIRRGDKEILLKEPPCPNCAGTGRIRVHGHVQCLTCKMNIEPCCSGDCTE